MCELPDVKFENFAAARSCLQSVLFPKGAILRDISIESDQNGKAKWRVHLASSGTFPAPTANQFVAVRAVLNQNIPARGVLSTIKLYTRFSTTEERLWEVTYSIKKVSKLRSAIATLTQTFKTLTPCLKQQPTIRAAIAKKDKLVQLERVKRDRVKFYQLRMAKRAAKQAATQVKEEAKPQETSKQRTRENKSPSQYGNFVKGEVLRPTKVDMKKTRTKPNVSF